MRGDVRDLEPGKRGAVLPDPYRIDISAGEQTSLFDLANLLFRHRRAVLSGAAIGVALALLPLLWTQRKYVATAAFTPQGNDLQRSGLSALAGQFGVAVPLGNQNQSPQFYADLLRSPVLLAPFARDSFVVPEEGGKSIAFETLFKTSKGTPQRRQDLAVKKLSDGIQARVALQTSVVTLVVETPWRSVSMAIAQRLLDRVNEFDLRNRQSQASNERRFVEARLNDARTELSAAENRLEAFLNSNRQTTSAALALARSRLERDVSLRQQVVNTLTQSFEDVRIREVRDTPVITVIQPPMAPERPASRRMVLRFLTGAIAGTFFAILVVISGEMLRRRRAAGDQHVLEFFEHIQQVRGRLSRGGTSAGDGPVAPHTIQ